MVEQVSPQYAGWCEQHGRAPLSVVIFKFFADALRCWIGERDHFGRCGRHVAGRACPTPRLDPDCSTLDFFH